MSNFSTCKRRSGCDLKRLRTPCTSVGRPIAATPIGNAASDFGSVARRRSVPSMASRQVADEVPDEDAARPKPERTSHPTCGTHDHAASGLERHAAPQLVAACPALLSRGDGTTTDLGRRCCFRRRIAHPACPAASGRSIRDARSGCGRRTPCDASACWWIDPIRTRAEKARPPKGCFDPFVGRRRPRARKNGRTSSMSHRVTAPGARSRLPTCPRRVHRKHRPTFEPRSPSDGGGARMDRGAPKEPAYPGSASPRTTPGTSNASDPGVADRRAAQPPRPMAADF